MASHFARARKDHIYNQVEHPLSEMLGTKSISDFGVLCFGFLGGEFQNIYK
jgi:hypothetical protein